MHRQRSKITAINGRLHQYRVYIKSIWLYSDSLKIHNVYMDYVYMDYYSIITQFTNLISIYHSMGKRVYCVLKWITNLIQWSMKMSIFFRTSLRNLKLPPGFYNCRPILGNVLIKSYFKIPHVFKMQTDSPRIKMSK